jgi:hypothetical protein
LALLPVIAWQGDVARVHGSYEYTHPAYEYQRALYQNYNVTYAENIRLLDPFRPERGLVDAAALAERMKTNFAEMPAALGYAVSTNAEFWGRALQRAQYRLLGRAVLPLRVVSAPIFGFAALVIAGLVVLIRRGAWLMVFVVLGSVGLICLAPWPEQFWRYLMPIVPFLTIAAVLASERFEAALRGSIWTTALARTILAGLLVLAFTVQVYAALWLFGQRAGVEGATFVPGRSSAGARFFYHDNSWRAWEQAAAWTGAHAAPGEIVATIAPHQLYLQTGLRAVYPPMDADPVRARGLLEAVPVSYVIVDKLRYRDFSRRYARPAVESDPVGWRLVWSFHGTQIYERSTGRP